MTRERTMVDADLALLLDAQRGSGAGAPPRSERLLARVARSGAASRTMHTVRTRHAPLDEIAPGVRVRELYAARGAATRAGEPQRVRWIELDAGASWRCDAAAAALQREWLVVRGDACLDDAALAPLDYRVMPAGDAVGRIDTASGAVLYLREAALPRRAGDAARTDRDDDGAWADFAPGIRRRVLWQRDGEAAMLYRAAADAAVPRHGHARDEECLMLDGDLFIDDVLLRSGDYQLAPAGTLHGGLYTDTGVVIYAHGDLDLDLQVSSS